MTADMLRDHGPGPCVLPLDHASTENPNYRTAVWTGTHIQLTLMSIPVGGDIGLEIHPDHDQFLRIEAGQGLVQMGDAQDNLTVEKPARVGSGIFVPAGTWHNVTNTGDAAMKVSSIYGPPKHPHGRVQATADSE